MVGWAFEKDGVGNCVKICREAQEDEYTDVNRVCDHKEVIGDLDYQYMYCGALCR